MDLRQMRHFVAVAEELHYGRAAQRLNMAQPPLSYSIKRLEEQLGVRLLERSRSGVWLTEVGAVFLAEARRTLLQATLTKEVTLRAAAGGPRQLSISFIGPALYYILPVLLIEFRRLHPQVDVRLHETNSYDQMTGLSEGRFDVCFVAPTVELMDTGDRFIVERGDLLLAAPSSSAIAQRPWLRMADLKDEPMILAPVEASPTRGSTLLAAFRSAGFMPKVVQEAVESTTRLHLVAAGIGSTLTMATAKLTGRAGVTFLPIIDLPSNTRWEMAIAWQPQHATPTTQAFVELTKAYIDANPEAVELDVSAHPLATPARTPAEVELDAGEDA